MISEGDPDLITYSNCLLRMNKPEQQKKTFWFPTHRISGKIEDHSPIQTGMFKELHNLKRKEKENPKDDAKSQTKFLQRFDWKVTLLTEAEKQAVEDILDEYYNIFAGHKMDVGLNT